MNNVIHILATNLRKERIRQGLTQAELAEKADLHNNYVGLIERAQCNVSVITLEKLARALSIQIVDLLKEGK